jgi:hypothetical protein
MSSSFLTAVSFIISLFLVACVSKPIAPQNITYGDRSTLAFSGKGAAAGMMMDAFMGGAGVAIGIAIDEGIAKDIAANISSMPGSFDMLELVKKEIILNSRAIDTVGKRKLASATKITVETFGFHSSIGEGDKVSAWLKMRFSSQDGELVLTYPDDFISPPVIDFNEAKKNPALAFNTLKDATDLVLTKWMSTLN